MKIERLIIMLMASFFAVISFSAAQAGSNLILGESYQTAAPQSLIRKVHDDDDEYYSDGVSPRYVRRLLNKRGFYGLYFTDRRLPLYKLRGCKRGLRYHIHVNARGKVLKCREVGYCRPRGYGYRGPYPRKYW